VLFAGQYFHLLAKRCWQKASWGPYPALDLSSVWQWVMVCL